MVLLAFLLQNASKTSVLFCWFYLYFKRIRGIFTFGSCCQSAHILIVVPLNSQAKILKPIYYIIYNFIHNTQKSNSKKIQKILQKLKKYLKIIRCCSSTNSPIHLIYNSIKNLKAKSYQHHINNTLSDKL